jgi:hypothetical protein
MFSMPGHEVSLGVKGEDMMQLDGGKLILVKADISQYSGDSESDRLLLLGLSCLCTLPYPSGQLQMFIFKDKLK